MALEWRQAGTWSRSYELFSGGTRIGSLSFKKAFGTLAEGEVDNAKYSFKRVGFLRPEVTIRKSPFEEDIGRIRLSFGADATLEFTDGKRYNFHRTSFWKGKWSFSDEQGDLLMTMQMDLALFRRGSEVMVEAKGREDGHFPVLVLLGWYIMVLMAEENSAAAASAAASS